jgi:HTH-type transcriptional regulator, competence development regulator
MEETFGPKLRALRRAAGVSQRELAEKVGVDFSYISKVENDRLPPPAADTIEKICNALGVGPDELMGLTNKLPSDLRQLLVENKGARDFMREAQGMRLSDREWDQLAGRLKRLRS